MKNVFKIIYENIEALILGLLLVLGEILKGTIGVVALIIAGAIGALLGIAQTIIMLPYKFVKNKIKM